MPLCKQVVGHENNLRGLLMHLDGISEAAVPGLEIPRAVPIKYQVSVSFFFLLLASSLACLLPVVRACLLSVFLSLFLSAVIRIRQSKSNKSYSY